MLDVYKSTIDAFFYVYYKQCIREMKSYFILWNLLYINLIFFKVFFICCNTLSILRFYFLNDPCTSRSQSCIKVQHSGNNAPVLSESISVTFVRLLYAIISTKNNFRITWTNDCFIFISSSSIIPQLTKDTSYGAKNYHEIKIVHRVILCTPVHLQKITLI